MIETIFIFVDERRLRRRIEQLKEFRKMGITSNKEAEEYENDKKKRVNFQLSIFYFLTKHFSSN